MGNAPSVDAHRRRTHKLSKPRTGNPATAGLLSPNGLSNSTGHFTSPRASPQPLPLAPAPSPTTPIFAAAQDSSGDLETPADQMVMVVTVQQREPRSWNLFRSLSSQGVSGRSRSRNSSVGRSSSRRRDKLGRTQSMTYESSLRSQYGAQVTSTLR